MPKVLLPVAVVAIILNSSVRAPVLAQPPVPLTEAPSTLWRFLGIPQTFTGSYDALANRRGNRPGLERRGRDARVRRIADPAFLDPEAPPLLKTAAQIKMQEDLAPQKIKALEYLGSIGCGCYDKDGEVTAAMLEGLADCTEEVRLKAVEVITEGACSEYCQFCRQRSCCKPALAKELDKMANGQDENGCWLEPSERVRAAAAQALRACGSIIVQSQPVQQQQGGGEDLPLTPEDNGQAPPVSPLDPPSELPMPQASRQLSPLTTAPRAPFHVTESAVKTGAPHHTYANTRAAYGRNAEKSSIAASPTVADASSGDLYGYFQPEPRGKATLVSSPQPLFDSPLLAGLDELEPLQPTPEAIHSAPVGEARARASTGTTRAGVIEAVDEAQGVVRVRFKHEGPIAAGTPVSIVHRALIGEIHVSCRVDAWNSGYATVRPFKSDLIGRLARGDEATLYIPRPVRITR